MHAVIAICLLPLMIVGSALVSSHQVASEEFQVTFLDVGQADAALINAGGNLYLVDVGEDVDVAEYLTTHQLQIEGIFISHAHDDHVGGLPAVLETVRPEWICLPEGYLGGEAEIASLSAIALAEEAGIQVRRAAAGDSIALSDEITAYVEYPASGMELDGGNESSMLLRVAYGQGSVLFTGDLPAEAEPMSVAPCSVLKVAHHGSAGSTSSRFLAQTRPSLAVISVGRINTYGHPSLELLERLAMLECKVMRTDENGAITVDIDRDGNVRARSYFQK